MLPVVIRYATRRANQRGLSNIRFAVCDAQRLLERFLRPHSVAEIHCYHPQPYYDPSQIHFRLITPSFLALVHRTLVPGGSFFIQSDNPGYWRYIREIVPMFFEFHERIGRWPDAPKGRTRREIMALRRGLPLFRGSGTARTDLDESAALRLAETLPPPYLRRRPPPARVGRIILQSVRIFLDPQSHSDCDRDCKVRLRIDG